MCSEHSLLKQQPNVKTHEHIGNTTPDKTVT